MTERVGAGAGAGDKAAATAEAEGASYRPRFEQRVAVRFSDLDPMGHAHHTLPIIYVEEARAAYWRDVVGRDTLAGIDYIIAGIDIRYHRRIPWPAELIVAVGVSHIGTKSFTMAFEVRSAAGEVLSSGTTVQVMYDYAAERSCAVPDEVRVRIEGWEGG